MRILLTIVFTVLLSMGSSSELSAQVKIQRSKQEITAQGKQYYLHVVGRGQTLFSIAKAYQVSEEAIIDKNPFVKNGIKTKQSLLIPTEATYKEWLSKKSTVGVGHKEVTNTTQKRDDSAKGQQPKRDSSVTDIDNVVPNVKPEIVKTGPSRTMSSRNAVNITMMLPLKEPSNRENENFADFYKGGLLALNTLKSEGVTTNLKLITTSQNMESIIANGSLDKSDLIIGPVYKDSFEPIAAYATSNRVPIVSPLAAIEGINSPYLFQATPNDITRYDKLKPLLKDPANNVILIRHTLHNEVDLFKELSAISHSGKLTVDYSKEMQTAALASMLDRERENVIVIPVDYENAVEEVLSRLGSINATARYKITVIGTSRWARFNNINFEMFFKLNTLYTTNYHYDKSDNSTATFYADYLEAFGTMPTMFSMRGYDVTLLFGRALSKYREQMPLEITNNSDKLLQVGYKFRQSDNASSFINQEWTLVNYTPQFVIEAR